jgi:hypothetical protein
MLSREMNCLKATFLSASDLLGDKREAVEPLPDAHRKVSGGRAVNPLELVAEMRAVSEAQILCDRIFVKSLANELKHEAASILSKPRSRAALKAALKESFEVS